MSDGRFERLVAIHELIEATLCDQANVDEVDVTNFDVKFMGDGEPGDSLNAPYHKQHRIATGIEVLLAQELGVDWQGYEKEISELKK
jgi:hypothetical protein